MRRGPTALPLRCRRMTGSTDRGLGKVLGLGLAVAALLGVAAAGGSLVRGTSNTATAGQAFPYAMMGALAGVVLVGIGVAAIRLARPGSLTLRPVEWLAILFVAAALGALIGAALTPETPRPDEVSPLDDDEIDRRREQSGEFSDRTRVTRVDRDGDGQPDVDADGNPILGVDIDGDGRIDGYLQPCPDGTPVPESRPGYVPIDDECDGTVDHWVPFDPEMMLPGDGSAREVAPPDTISPTERAERARDEGADGQRGGILGKLLLILLAIAVGAAIIAYLVRMPDRKHGDDEPAEPPADDEPPPPDLSRSFEASLDAMLDDPDPRQAICAAYGKLLDGLAEVGLQRRVEEAPEEHMRRCFASARIDEAAAGELVGLFSLARFSPHPVDEQHRLAAVRAMRAALVTAAPQAVAAGAITSLPAPPPAP